MKGIKNYRSGVNLTMSCKGHLNKCWVNTQPITGVAIKQEEALNKNNFRATLRSGFTLIELLVVVLIIGILAAVALPQYQKAVLKSRYSALMPLAKAVANSNEIYYMEKGHYAAELNDLDLRALAEYPDGTIVSLSDDEKYDFVLVTRDDKNNYVVYQKHSENFAGNIDCEALTGNDMAQEVCKALGGDEVGENGKYTVYRLSGNATGKFLSMRKLKRKLCWSDGKCAYYFENGDEIGTSPRSVAYPDEEPWTDCNNYISCGAKKGAPVDATSVTWKIPYALNGSAFRYDEDGNLLSADLVFSRDENGDIVFGDINQGGPGFVQAFINADGEVVRWNSYLDYGSTSTMAYCYANGQIFQFGGNYYYEDGTPLKESYPDLSAYKINPADYLPLIEKYTSKTQCELFPEIDECK